ncbi:hypothetical protein B1729_03005 [Microbacterium sp. B35-04]|uniref:hypothetical protein n=1 Tax=Microbacterium sp. B35-04 TaxID=1961716 RepID=UPI0013D1FD38|nr:hypothetical protein [Microbacterium sp. B35-04]KAF2414815.1 hypothetical protein B1729_03005 [Microbacterium sp. B35-04]
MEHFTAAPSGGGLDRRQLLRLGAWGAPALVVASAVPAAAASNETSALIASSFANTIGSVGGWIFHEPLATPDTVTPTGTLTLVVNVPLGYTFTRSDSSTAWSGPASVTGGSTGTYVHVPAPGGYAAYGGANSIYGAYTGSGEFTGRGSVVITAAATTVRPAIVPAGSTTVEHVGATPVRTIPASKLTVLTYDLSNVNTGGAGLGPIAWAGGLIEYTGVFGDATSGKIVWSSVLHGPSSQVLASRSGTASINLYGGHALSAETFGTAPMEPGVYELELTAYGSDRSVSTSKTITLGG